MSYKIITDAHPFSSYEEIVANIHAWPNKIASKRMYAEFDEEIYEQMKNVYESGLDPEVWRNFGRSICTNNCDDNTSMHVMNILFDIFVRFSPFAKHYDEETNDQIVDYLNGLWHRIGWWRV